MPIANESSAVGATFGSQNSPNDEPTVLVRKLGSACVPTYLERVLTPDGEHQFVVVERLSRGSMTDGEASESVREARMAAALEHPNVVRTRAVTVRLDEISVTSDYVAGERLSELWSKLPLEIALRIVVDVSTGLGALHKLRSEEGQERIKYVHGEVTSSNVLVGLDGVSGVLRASRVRRPKVLPIAGMGTLAPEVLSGAAVDHRADVYSLGALLWQALSGKPLFADDDVDTILASLKRGEVARAVVARDTPWALPLADVAARALAVAPEKRFPTASSMVTELRRIAGPKLATAVAVADFVEAVAGEKIAARLSDVQASAVIRKATSVPAPRPSPTEGPAPAITPQRPGPSKRPIQRADRAESKPPAAAVTKPIDVRSIAPTVAIAPPVSVLPRTETARSRALPQAPPAPEKRPSPAAVPMKVTPKRAAAVERSPVERRPSPVRRAPIAKPSPALSAPEPTSWRPSRRAVLLAIGAWLILALLTGWFALRAIRNRQEIVTPGAAQLDIAPVPASAASAVAFDKAEPAAAATTSAKALPVKPSAPRKAAPPMPRRK